MTLLLKINKKLKAIIIKKIEKNDKGANLRMALEKKMIQLINDEYRNHVQNFDLILNENDFKISISDEAIQGQESYKVLKLFFAKDMGLLQNKLMRLIQLFYECESNSEWIPGITQVTTVKYFL